MVIVAILSFIGIFIFALPFPFIILVAALIGYIGNKSGSKAFNASSSHSDANSSNASLAAIDAALLSRSQSMYNLPIQEL